MALTKSQQKQAERNRKYWADREAEQLKHNITEEEEFKKEIDKIYRDMLDGVQNEIYSFYGKYATKEGISMTEAKKRVSQADIKALERKAKQYVKDAAKDRRANFGKTDTEAYYFSDEANEEMRLYNLTMKVNRLEMLKANIGLELIDGHSKLEKFMSEILQGRTEKELKRQAGILGKTVQNNAQTAKVIVNASFHNAKFSQRIWMYNDAMKADLSKLLQTGLIQGKNARVLAKEMEKYFIGEEKLKNGKKGAKYHAETLMITELARVQIEAQKESFIRNGFTQYTFHANSGCCSICDALNGKHFDIKDMMPGKNAPPMHPRCRCSVSAYEDSTDYEAWLDYLSEGGTTEEWNRLKKQKEEWNKAFVAGTKVTKKSKKNDKKEKEAVITEESLTDTDVKAIHDYMSAKSYVVNEKLRTGTDLSDEEQEFVTNLDKALEKMPTYKGNLQRSLYFNSQDDIMMFMKDYTIDNKVSYNEYISTTKGNLYNPEGQIQIYIQNSKKGRDISSLNEAEKEVLYQRETTFKVIYTTEEEGIHYILLEEYDE